MVGGYEIGGPSLWRDEAYTKDAITRPFSQIFALLGHQDAVHGAYYLLMHVIAAGDRHLGHRAAVPLAVRHGHRDRVHRGDRPPGGRRWPGPPDARAAWTSRR